MVGNILEMAGKAKRERERALRKLEGMGPLPPMVGLTSGVKGAVLSVSIIVKKERARY